MRLPFLQVDWDFLATSAGDLAELLRTSEAEAGWAMVRLWGWCITKAATPEALGVLAGDDMQRLAERAAGWKGEPGAFLTAICGPAVALAQRETDGTIRLLGMERYAATYRKQESDRARKSRGSRAEVAATAPGTPAEVARKTQTQTQTQTQTYEKLPAPVAGAPAPSVPDPLVLEASPAPPGYVATPAFPSKPRKEATGAHPEAFRALEAKFLEVMGKPYVTANGNADGAAVAWFLGTAKADQGELLARWERLLNWSRTSRNGYPGVTGFVTLRQHWNAPEVLGLRGGLSNEKSRVYTEGESRL